MCGVFSINNENRLEELKTLKGVHDERQNDENFSFFGKQSLVKDSYHQRNSQICSWAEQTLYKE